MYELWDQTIYCMSTGDLTNWNRGGLGVYGLEA